MDIMRYDTRIIHILIVPSPGAQPAPHGCASLADAYNVASLADAYPHVCTPILMPSSAR